MSDEANFKDMLAKRHMIATDHLSPGEWMAHAERLTPEQLQREILRQTTDTKLQLISVLNALHFILVAMCLFLAIIAWRLW